MDEGQSIPDTSNIINKLLRTLTISSNKTQSQPSSTLTSKVLKESFEDVKNPSKNESANNSKTPYFKPYTYYGSLNESTGTIVGGRYGILDKIALPKSYESPYVKQDTYLGVYTPPATSPVSSTTPVSSVSAVIPTSCNSSEMKQLSSMDMHLFMSMQAQILEKLDLLLDNIQKQELKRKENNISDMLVYIMCGVIIMYGIHMWSN